MRNKEYINLLLNLLKKSKQFHVPRFFQENIKVLKTTQKGIKNMSLKVH